MVPKNHRIANINKDRQAGIVFHCASLIFSLLAAVSGSEFVSQIASLDRLARDAAILREIAQGNVPQFSRKFVKIAVRLEIDGKEHALEYSVAPDYLAVGSDADFFLAPLSPGAAQKAADSLDCLLPTRKMVDQIYAAAEVKLAPSPIPPSPAMTTAPVFEDHNRTIQAQRAATNAPLGALIAGHKKDVVITPRLAESRGKVAIYGWHKPDGKPIQPLYLGHGASHVDYSHGIRLVSRHATLDGKPARLEEVLADPNLCVLLSDEGPIRVPRYPTD